VEPTAGLEPLTACLQDPESVTAPPVRRADLWPRSPFPAITVVDRRYRSVRARGGHGWGDRLH